MTVMATFIDGPAKGVTLFISKAPVFVRPSFLDRWDALFEAVDSPADGESLYAYKIAQMPFWSFIDSTRFKGKCLSASYSFCADQPPNDVLRDNQRWIDWCNSRFLHLLFSS